MSQEEDKTTNFKSEETPQVSTSVEETKQEDQAASSVDLVKPQKQQEPDAQVVEKKKDIETGMPQDMITNDRATVAAMYKQSNMLKGYMPTFKSETKDEQEDTRPKHPPNPNQRKPHPDDPRTYLVPEKLYLDFKEVHVDNENLFACVTESLIMSTIEKLEENNKWMIKFPQIIPSMGRSIIHDIATYFGLASHSQGKVKRFALVYPRSLYADQQEKERTRLERDLQKIRDKYQGRQMIGVDYEKPKTMRDKMLALVYHEGRNEPDKVQIQKIKDEIFGNPNIVPLGLDEYHAWVAPRIAAKKQELAEKGFAEPEEGTSVENPAATADPNATKATPASDTSKIQKNPQTQTSSQKQQKESDPKQKEDTKSTTNTSKKEKVEDLPFAGKNTSGSKKEVKMTAQEEKKDGESSADEAEVDEEIDAEEIQKELKRQKAKLEEAKKLREYEEKLNSNTLQSFKDKPDPVEWIRVLNSLDTSLWIEWDAPADNNEKITCYRIFFAESMTSKSANFVAEIPADENSQEQYPVQYQLVNLAPDTIYYVRVRAVNSLGEGYQAKEAQFVRTLKDRINNAADLYVWGNNSNSELGLTDELVSEHKDSYHKFCMMKPVKHTQFDGMLYQAALGNVNSLFICYDKANQSTMLITAGMSCQPNEGQEDIQRSELFQEDLHKFTELPSLPFMLEFRIPVTSVVCGEGFMGFLTASGRVFTQGFNRFGQLGIGREEVCYVQHPMPVQFADPSSKSSKRKFAIKELSCGFNHCVALTDENNVFVWGRRMGVYPNIELSHDFLKAKGQMLKYEIHQGEPRLLKDNLIFYQVRKLVCGLNNSAVITQENQVLVQGMNDFGQLALGDSLGPEVPFFPNFLKLDFFQEKKLNVVDVSFTALSSHFLCWDEQLSKYRVFSAGNNDFGNLGNGSSLKSYVPVEITDKFDSEIVQIESGGFHTLALSDDGDIYAFGKITKGQHGQRWSKGQTKFASKPVKVPGIPKEKHLRVTDISCGSLFNSARVEHESTSSQT